MEIFLSALLHNFLSITILMGDIYLLVIENYDNRKKTILTIHLI